MEEDLSRKGIQEVLFSASAVRSSDKFPLTVTLSAVPEGSLAHSDLTELKEKGLIAWDLPLKASQYMTPVSNFEHMLQCVVYYGNAEKGRSCIGFALGCINKENTAIELNFIEKRSDAGDDFKSKFLPIIVDAFTLYALYLNEREDANISKFVIMGPLEQVIPYYKTSGFIYQNDYNGSGADALYKELCEQKVDN